MTNPTTPFSWQMPTSTDLVTDLPADFEVFGQAVATSMADLLGGTTGQVLAKASNTDMDFSWVAQDDSNAIQNAIVDAKGDLIAATANDTPARLAVGTNGQILTADSTAATGIKWAAPAVFPTFSAYAATNQSISTATWTKITFGTEEWDTNTNFASSRFTPTVAGYYTISGRVDLSGLTTATTAYLALYKNGANYKTLSSFTYSFNSIGFGGSSTVYFNGSTDYVELYAYVNAGTPVITGGTGVTDATWFNGIGVQA